jgi:hypothetical protein
MSDGPVSSPEANLASQGEILQNKEGISLYKSEKFNVFVPKKPNIPLNEGLHIQVSDGHDRDDSPRDVLARYLMMEGAVKMLGECSLTPDVFPNTRLEKGQIVAGYGRVFGEDSSMGKPVDTLNRNVPEISSLEPNYNTQKLQELSSRYLPKWEELVSNMELFKDGINGKDMNEVTKDVARIWENDKIKLELVMNPHLKGLHLMVSPKESFRRQWQTVKPVADEEKKTYIQQEQIYLQQTLEVTAVAMGVQKLLGGEGELHNSGNWAQGLKSTEEGGKFDLENLLENRKAEKRSHRPDIATPEMQINTGMHTHVYIPEKGAVILPEMSKQEAIEKGRTDIVKQWDEIPPANSAQLEEVRIKLSGGKLTQWLEENCKGKLRNSSFT